MMHSKLFGDGRVASVDLPDVTPGSRKVVDLEIEWEPDPPPDRDWEHFDEYREWAIEVFKNVVPEHGRAIIKLGSSGFTEQEIYKIGAQSILDGCDREEVDRLRDYYTKLPDPIEFNAQSVIAALAQALMSAMYSNYPESIDAETMEQRLAIIQGVVIELIGCFTKPMIVADDESLNEVELPDWMKS